LNSYTIRRRSRSKERNATKILAAEGIVGVPGVVVFHSYTLHF